MNKFKLSQGLPEIGNEGGQMKQRGSFAFYFTYFFIV